MKAATFNTYGFAVGPFGLWKTAPDRRDRLDRIGRWLRDRGIELAFLQELYGRADGKRVREASGLEHGYFPGHGSGLGILSRFPLSKRSFTPFRWQGSHPLEGLRLAARMKHGLATAQIDLEGRPVLVGVTHLLARYHGVDGFASPADALTPERLANLLELGTALKASASGGRWILAGDLNMNYESAEYAFFRRFEGWGDALFDRKGGVVAGEATYAGDNPWVAAQGNPGEGVLDYVLYSKGAFEARDAEIRPETDALSDHRAVVADLDPTGEPASLRLPRLASDESRALRAYFRRVRLPWSVYAAPWTGWTQRRDILRFLDVKCPP